MTSTDQPLGQPPPQEKQVGGGGNKGRGGRGHGGRGGRGGRGGGGRGGRGGGRGRGRGRGGGRSGKGSGNSESSSVNDDMPSEKLANISLDDGKNNDKNNDKNQGSQVKGGRGGGDKKRSNNSHKGKQAISKEGDNSQGGDSNKNDNNNNEDGKKGAGKKGNNTKGGGNNDNNTKKDGNSRQGGGGRGGKSDDNKNDGRNDNDSSKARGGKANAKQTGAGGAGGKSDATATATNTESQSNDGKGRKRNPKKGAPPNDSHTQKEDSAPKKGGNNNNNNQKGGGKGNKNENKKHVDKGEKNSNNPNKPQQQPFQNKPGIPPNQPQQTNDINYGKGTTISILHVAEKPSIGQAIANGLCKGEMRSNTRGGTPVLEFTNPSFPKAPHAKKTTHKVTSVTGHVFSVDFPQQFQSWDSVDPAELFQAPVLRKPNRGSIVKHLQTEAKGVDFIVLWMDCDREGENINFEVLDCCMHLMQGGGGVAHYDRVYRAHFSAINPSDIIKAYNALGKPDKNQALAVDARQELDLKVGVAFSRFQTRFFQGRYGDLDSAVLSYGPCQTPTLGFCAQRHIDIETFKPEPYWTLELGILKRGRRLKATWEAGRSFNQNRTEGYIAKALETNAVVKVTNVVTKDKKQGRPVPLNTVGMLKACSKALGIGPHATMQAAERLYLSGYLSYPRTESSAYPKSFDITGTLQQQASDGRWGPYVRELLKQGHNKSRGGVDMGDHPPITPCRSAGPHELSGDMARIYDLVVRHFIASVSEDAVWQSTKISFEIEALGEKGKFFVSGKQIVSPGFLAIVLHKEYGDEADNDGGEEDEEEQTIPEFTKGEIIPILQGNKSSDSKVSVATASPVWASLEVKQKMTTAPGYLTESELIGLMEKHGIGTDASIPTHIENILKRNYVRLESGRRLLPNQLGLVLVNGYHSIDSGLVLPKVRSDIEGQCNRIAKGEMDKDQVVKRAIEIFEGKFDYFVKNIDKMDVLFGSSFSKLEDVGKAFTRCGHTRRYLQYIAGPPPRLYNRFTETVYPLPAGGIVKQWSGRTCPVEGCNFELALYSVGNPPRTFPLCPNCFNSADWALEDTNTDDPVDKEDENKERQIKRMMAGKSLVLECPLPDEHPLIDELTVSPDPDSDGVFILDPHFGPKWRLVSTRDATIIYLPKSIDKIIVLDQKDDVLGCHMMKVIFKEGESPLEGGATKHICSYATDPLLQGSSRVYHGSERLKAQGRGGRGRGRGGRGRGGRGRGGRGRR